jgi:5-formyltetrahydrofolate cyclo-ligase
VFTSAHEISCYLPRASEFDTTAIIAALWRTKKNCYLPLLAEGEEKVLHFVRYLPEDVLNLNRYEIYEPAIRGDFFPPAQLDLVLLPLYGFDRTGHRLGSGGGYYDRTFAFKKSAPTPLLIGVGFARQEINDLPHDTWDVPLDGILTESSFQLF